MWARLAVKQARLFVHMKIVCLSPCCNLFFHVPLFFLSSRALVVVVLYPWLTVSVQYFWCAAVSPSCDHFENSSLLFFSESKHGIRGSKKCKNLLPCSKVTELGRKPVQLREPQQAWPPGFSLARCIVRSCCVMIPSCLTPIICWDLPMFLVWGKSTSGPDPRNLSPYVFRKMQCTMFSQFLLIEIHPQAQRSTAWEHSWRLEWKEVFWFVFYKWHFNSSKISPFPQNVRFPCLLCVQWLLPARDPGGK